jgi:hypothetical protein
VKKRGARIAIAEVGPGTGRTDEAVSQAANSPTARVQRAAYIREEVIETYFKGQVRLRRDRCTSRKFISPGTRGVSDQLCIWGHPLCTVEFVELKPPEGYALQKEQTREHQHMEKLGHKVHTLYTKADVDEYFRLHDKLMSLT